MTESDSHVLSVGDVELTIDLATGARATRWLVDGLSLLATYGPASIGSGMYPMAPWAGRLRDNSVPVDGRPVALPVTNDGWALHGTVLASHLVLIAHEQAKDHAHLTARTVEHDGWPWPMAVDISWDLRPRVLETTITVHALSEPFPVVVGWHPWFARRLERGDPIEWTMAATAQAERGSDYLPTGALLDYDPARGPFDDTFLVPDGRAQVKWPGALAVDIECDSPWYVVFDQLPIAACVEPQSGPPNGVNDGLGRPIPVSAPGRPHQLTTTWIMRDDLPGDPG